MTSSSRATSTTRPTNEGEIRNQSSQAKESQNDNQRDYNYNTKPLLLALPPELHLMIFELLDTVTSACFGLTSKRFYPIHWAQHGRVWLSTRSTTSAYDSSGFNLRLYSFLKTWMGAQRTFDAHSIKYVTHKKKSRLQNILLEGRMAEFRTEIEKIKEDDF